MSASRLGKWRYSVPMPTPARAAMVSSGTSWPCSANSATAALSSRSLFRCASARGWRATRVTRSSFRS